VKRVRASQPRLCTIVHGPYPVGEPRVARQVQVALDEGFAVDVLAHRRPGEARCENVQGARVIRTPLLHKQGSGGFKLALEYFAFTFAASLTALALGIRRPYRVIHVSNPPDILMLAAAWPKILGARVIFDVHDFSSDLFALRFGDRPGSRLIERMLLETERLAGRAADVVLVPHEPYRRQLIARGTPADKIKVVMNSVDERLLPANASNMDRSESRSDSPFRVVYHGTLTPHYGVDVLVEAVPLVVAEVSNVRAEIYGEGDSLPALCALADRLAVRDRVYFSRKSLAHGDVLAAVAGASVGVVPNYPQRHDQLALSGKLLEYVAMGIPVVAADLAATREHFSEDEVLYFVPGDPESLAAAVLSIARDQEAARRRAVAARRRYEAYRWPRYAREYAQALRT
jgi:glycosyltransferase involved in cell wall biosynthesis